MGKKAEWRERHGTAALHVPLWMQIHGCVVSHEHSVAWMLSEQKRLGFGTSWEVIRARDDVDNRKEWGLDLVSIKRKGKSSGQVLGPES